MAMLGSEIGGDTIDPSQGLGIRPSSTVPQHLAPACAAPGPTVLDEGVPHAQPAELLVSRRRNPPSSASNPVE